MLPAIINDPVFNGVGLFIHKIIHKGWLTSQRNNVPYEDYLQDFTVLWLKRRSKYDASRGAMTTFAGVVARSFVLKRIRTSKNKKNSTKHYSGVYDIDQRGFNPDAEEIALIEAYEKLESKKAIGIVNRLCTSTQMNQIKVMELAESIQHKVQNRNRSAIAVRA